MAIPLARRGVSVTGIKLSHAMIARLRERPIRQLFPSSPAIWPPFLPWANACWSTWSTTPSPTC
ncbi:MAG: hypothetical protein K2Q25_13465 [Mycobacteriaceae bacterium]|nr:hypothetical protein [Mycobacteriaceae bacterium]